MPNNTNHQPTPSRHRQPRARVARKARSTSNSGAGGALSNREVEYVARHFARMLDSANMLSAFGALRLHTYQLALAGLDRWLLQLNAKARQHALAALAESGIRP